MSVVMQDKYIVVQLAGEQLVFMPESIVQKYAIYEWKPVSLVNTFTQDYHKETEELVVSEEKYEACTEVEEVVVSREEKYEAYTETVEVTEAETEESVLNPPDMQKSATIEHEDIDDTEDSVSVVSSDVSSVIEHEHGVLESDSDFEETDSGLEVKEEITQMLPTYETKVAMTVRSDCTRDAPVIHTLGKKARVYLLENGVEKFPYQRLVRWWRKTFAGMNMDAAADYIRQHKITGQELSAFGADTRLKLGIETYEYDVVRKALKLVKRKAQVVYFDENGVSQRGWISKTKKGKQTISRIFQNTTPSLVVRYMNNYQKTIEECEEDMAYILQDKTLNFDDIKFGTRFHESRRGNEYILRKGRRIHGNWKPESHCIIEFATYMDAAVALNKLSGCSELSTCEVDFSREYANLTEVTYPKF